MNFLAHLYLSGNQPDIIIGNFIADHVKGSKSKRFSLSVQTGILLHREIDAFTDHHPLVLDAVGRIRKEFRKYAGVVLDMYYDHFLSSEWAAWSDEPLQDFSKRMFAVIRSAESILPPRTLHMLPFMMDHDWLSAYGNFEGLDRAFNGMARRTPFRSNMETAVGILRNDYDYFRESFTAFFPELIAHSADYRKIIGAE